jgi:hypothetical protein
VSTGVIISALFLDDQKSPDGLVWHGENIFTIQLMGRGVITHPCPGIG